MSGAPSPWGAELLPDGARTRFRLWAPSATEVALVIEEIAPPVVTGAEIDEIARRIESEPEISLEAIETLADGLGRGDG